jgi:glycosyltransferase involved in cell wall biosynthesis
MGYMISVIIPVFNGEQYIQECFASIINQTLGIENIEVIVVDDSSTDNSVEIISQYVEKYESFKLIKQDANQGSGPARNLGLKYVTSDYVTFLDCDDYISLDAYEKALEIFKNDESVDLVMYKWEEFDENGLLNHNDLAKTSLKQHKIVTDINESPKLIFATYVYIKVYAKRLFPYLVFPPLSYQDNIASARVMINANKIYVADDICCYYRQREDSVSKEVSARNYLNILIAAKQVLDLRESSSDKYYNVLSYLALKLTYHSIYYICKKPGFTLKEGEIVYSELKNYPKYFSKDILQEYQEKFPNYLQCSEQALWDINEMDYYEYVVKNRCQDTIKNLNNQKNELSKKNRLILNKNRKFAKKNKKLKKKLSKQNKINKEILNSRSWKLTSIFRKLKNLFS